MLKEIDGDLIQLGLKGEFDVICHGCNCFHAMGSGIAAGIKRYFPEAYRADLKTQKGFKSKLGSISYGKHGNLTIANMYTQFHWSKISPDGTLEPAPRGTVLVDYEAVRNCFSALKFKYEYLGTRIGVPMIGAGLARGDWARIRNIIEEETEDLDVTIVKYKP
jgi:O-acetyl-ADP-ribose deacetylase (regulator of RNase III)